MKLGCPPETASLNNLISSSLPNVYRYEASIPLSAICISYAHVTFFHFIHPLRRVSFCKRTGIAESGLPYWVNLPIVARGGPPFLGSHFPASTIAKCQMRICPSSPGGVFFFRWNAKHSQTSWHDFDISAGL
jgi:hypothetical protein